MQIDPLGLANGPAIGWMKNPGTSRSSVNPNGNNECTDPCISITKKGICDGQDSMCPMAMQAAGISGPYYGSTRRYNWKCLLTLGVAGKIGGAAVGNYAASKAPGVAKAMGASARTVSVVTKGAAIWTNPYFTAAAVAAGLVAVVEECECDK